MKQERADKLIAAWKKEEQQPYPVFQNAEPKLPEAQMPVGGAIAEPDSLVLPEVSKRLLEVKAEVDQHNNPDEAEK